MSQRQTDRQSRIQVSSRVGAATNAPHMTANPQAKVITTQPPPKPLECFSNELAHHSVSQQDQQSSTDKFEQTFCE